MLDIIGRCEAYYMYYSQYHSGQWSDEYRKMSLLLKAGFKPRRSLNDEDDLEPDARELYDSLVHRFKMSNPRAEVTV